MDHKSEMTLFQHKIPFNSIFERPHIQKDLISEELITGTQCKVRMGGLNIQRRHMCIAPCGNASPRCPPPSSASPSRPPCRRPCPRAARSCRRGSCKSTAPARRRTGTGLSCGELYASEDLMIQVNSLNFWADSKACL